VYRLPGLRAVTMADGRAAVAGLRSSLAGVRKWSASPLYLTRNQKRPEVLAGLREASDQQATAIGVAARLKPSPSLLRQTAGVECNFDLLGLVKDAEVGIVAENLTMHCDYLAVQFVHIEQEIAHGHRRSR
jgi:hypothetical protein